MSIQVSDFLSKLAAKAREPLDILDGTIKNVIYLDHKNAKNWVAVVTRDFTAQGGLARVFFKHGPKDRVFLPEDLKQGDWLEFGGDKLSTGGSKRVKRAYREVIAITPEQLIVKPITFEDVGRAPGDTREPIKADPFFGISDEAIWAEVVKRKLNCRVGEDT